MNVLHDRLQSDDICWSGGSAPPLTTTLITHPTHITHSTQPDIPSGSPRAPGQPGMARSSSPARRGNRCRQPTEASAGQPPPSPPATHLYTQTKASETTRHGEDKIMSFRNMYIVCMIIKKTVFSTTFFWIDQKMLVSESFLFVDAEAARESQHCPRPCTNTCTFFLYFPQQFFSHTSEHGSVPSLVSFHLN